MCIPTPNVQSISIRTLPTQNYIRPLLFGDGSSGGSGSSSGAGGSARKRRRKSPEELMEDMSRSVEKSVASINQELTRVKEEMARNARQDSLHREISGFKADLDAIKGLLLNRFVVALMRKCVQITSVCCVTQETIRGAYAAAIDSRLAIAGGQQSV